MSRLLPMGLAVLLWLTACSTDNSGEVDRDEEIQVSIYKGKGYMSRQNPQMALPSLRRVQELEPDNVENLILLGRAYYLLERPIQSQAVLQRVLELRPNQGEVHNHLGVVLLRLNQIKEAEEHFHLALTDPNFLSPEEAYYNLAILEKSANNVASMAEFLQKALKLKPNHVASHLELASHYYRMGDMVREQDHLNAVLAEEPKNITVLEKLASSYQKSGDTARNRTTLRKIAEISSESDGDVKAVGRFDLRDENTYEDK